MGGDSTKHAENQLTLSQGQGQAKGWEAGETLAVGEGAFTGLTGQMGKWDGMDPLDKGVLDVAKNWQVSPDLAAAFSTGKGYGLDAQYWKESQNSIYATLDKIGWVEGEGPWIEGTGHFLNMTADYLNDKQSTMEELAREGRWDEVDALQSEVDDILGGLDPRMRDALVDFQDENVLAEYHGRSKAGQIVSENLERGATIRDEDSQAAKDFYNLAAEPALNQLRVGARENQRIARDFGAGGGGLVAPNQAQMTQGSIMRQTSVDYANVQAEAGRQLIQYQDWLEKDSVAFASQWAANQGGIRDSYQKMNIELASREQAFQAQMTQIWGNVWAVKNSIDTQQAENKKNVVKNSILGGITMVAGAVISIVATPAAGAPIMAAGASMLTGSKVEVPTWNSNTQPANAPAPDTGPLPDDATSPWEATGVYDPDVYDTTTGF